MPRFVIVCTETGEPVEEFNSREEAERELAQFYGEDNYHVEEV